MWYLLVILLSKASALFLPQLQYDVNTAVVWKCPILQPADAIRPILYQNISSKYVVTSNNEQLINCTLYAELANILANANEQLNQHDVMKRDINHSSWFQAYHNLSTLYDWYEQLANRHSSLVTVKPIGTTSHGRPLLSVHITKSRVDKPVIYIQCLLHPREWITGPVCMFIAQLLTSADSNNNNNILLTLLDKVKFIIVPVANPDGYYLTWLDYPKYRLWRKNLSINRGSTCLGVDLNRNFNIKWNKYGSSSNPCSDTYRGANSESELEVLAISHYLLNYPQPILGVIDLHSFSQAVLYPHAWTRLAPPNAPLLKYIAQWTASTANQIGNNYRVEQMCALYLASGTFNDWLLSDIFIKRNRDRLHQYIPIPLTIELPPDGHHSVTGFMVPPNKILPICNEIAPAIIKFASLVVNHKKHLIKTKKLR